MAGSMTAVAPRRDGADEKKLGAVQLVLLIAVAILMLGWLYLMLAGLREPVRDGAGANIR